MTRRKIPFIMRDENAEFAAVTQLLQPCRTDVRTMMTFTLATAAAVNWTTPTMTTITYLQVFCSTNHGLSLNGRISQSVYNLLPYLGVVLVTFPTPPLHLFQHQRTRCSKNDFHLRPHLRIVIIPLTVLLQHCQLRILPRLRVLLGAFPLVCHRNNLLLPP